MGSTEAAHLVVMYGERELKAMAEGAKVIPLTQGKFAIVDAEDYEELSKIKWYAICPKKGHASYAGHAGIKGKIMHMHRHILSWPTIHVDHINRDGLDNRRANLRLATGAQNQWNRKTGINNTTGAKGVAIFNNRGKIFYRARITLHRKRISLGLFETVEEASAAYEVAAKEMHGEFARF